jgi:serine/threonine-protein kinase
VDGTPFGRYRLIELLGRGGMSEVSRAYDTAIDRVMALKLVPRELRG